MIRFNLHVETAIEIDSASYLIKAATDARRTIIQRKLYEWAVKNQRALQDPRWTETLVEPNYLYIKFNNEHDEMVFALTWWENDNALEWGWASVEIL